jgi:PAS domain S-box-containing protein
MSEPSLQTLSEQALTEIRAILPDADLVSRVVASLEPLLAQALRTQELLKTTESMLRALVTDFPSGVVSIFDLEMRHVMAGGETSGHLNFDLPQMIGKKPSEFRPSDKSDRLETLIRRTLRGEMVRGLEYDGDRTTLVISTPIYDDDRNIVGAMVVGQDVTDLVLLQEEKFEQERARAALEREVATSRARAGIIEQVLHEVRNPLASLSSSVEMLQHYDDRMSSEKRADHLRRIYLEVRTLAKTLSQLAQIED